MSKKNELIQKRGYLVVKSNDFIQKSRFQLSLQEQKIILYMISKIKPNDEDFIYQNFNVAEFCEVCGIDSTSGKNYKAVKDTIKNLADKSLWVKVDSGAEVLMRWINKAWIIEKSGTIKIKLDDDMKPYLLQLQERFTQYELFYILPMKSQYSIRLYELLKSYEYNKRQITFEIEYLKCLLFAQSYIRYPDFQRKVLDIAMREINELTDMIVSYKPVKVSRRYEKIEFAIRKKNGKERLKAFDTVSKIINPTQPQISLLEEIYPDK